MDDLLKPIKTTKKVQTNISKFESLSSGDNKFRRRNGDESKSSFLKIDAIHEEAPALTATGSKNTEKRDIKQLKTVNIKFRTRPDSTIFLRHSYLDTSVPTSLPDDAAAILKSQPSHEDLKAVLEYLRYGIDGRHDFNILVTGPQSSKIVNLLVTITIPDMWTTFDQKTLSSDEASIRKLVVLCLTSSVGLAALTAQIRYHSARTSEDQTNITLINMVEVVNVVLKSSKTLINLLEASQKLYATETQKRLYWQEICTLLGGGRVLSTVAQALTNNQSSKTTGHLTWLANGSEYSAWLARNIAVTAMTLQPTDHELWGLLVSLFKRALSLGHKESLVSQIYTSLLIGSRAYWTALHQLLQRLSPHEQKTVFDTILFDLSKKYLAQASILELQDRDTTRKAISGVAALVAGVVKHNEVLEEHLEEWLIVTNSSYAAVGLATRRAIIAVLANSEDKLERILERALASFADKVQIQHDPVLRQDAYTETIILTIGCIARIKISSLTLPVIASLTMRSVSNRLAASLPRARFLGMLIGVSVSRFIDKPDQVLNFGVEEMESQEAKNWLHLVDLQDNVGEVTDLKAVSTISAMSKSQTSPSTLTIQTRNRPPALQTSKIMSIEEVFDSSESDDEDDLIPYDKPDADPEDSDEDPTLVDRNKQSAPVYIVDLIKYLSKNDQPGTIELALQVAPSLIRRKAGFGTEVADNIHSLATTLVNMQEAITGPELQQLRLQSLIACVVAQPAAMGSSLAILYFDGDFSISQRMTLLTAIGLGAREVAGFKDETASIEQNLDFPSKRLPSHLEPASKKQLQAQKQDPITALTTTVAQNTIRPMTLAAADKMTGPAVLKIRTFSSRLDVEKQKDKKAQARTKMIPKDLHKLLTESFYLPLCCRMSLLLLHAGQSNLNITIMDPALMKMLMQTMTLILHTLGPSASLYLPTLTHETLLFLTALHLLNDRSTDPVILPAMLHLFLALIDLTIEAGVTAQERLVTEQGKQVVELVNWISELNDKTSIPVAAADGKMPWTVLAAGIQVKWFEIGQRLQGRILGLMNGDFDNF